MKLQAARGTYDILPEQWAPRRHLETSVRRVFGRAGVQEIATPIFEHSEVFDRSVGETADLVVQKEMYTFERGDRSLTLRPEFTGGVLRAFIEHGMYTRPLPVKLWSIGPVFRAERPQRGRYHQFHQVNCELLGLDTPLLDAEAIGLLHSCLHELGLRGLQIRLGSVGDPGDRDRYNDYLRQALAGREAELTPESRERLHLNPMRILDSKAASDQQLLAGLKRPFDLLGTEARSHFDEVARLLDAMGIPTEIDTAIVRGLDYYRRTAFEIHSREIGAQSALCGGGRYDGLVQRLGGPATPGVGWAFGIERVLDALDTSALPAESEGQLDLYLVALDDTALEEIIALTSELRRHHRVDHGYSARRPGKGLAEADRAGARFAALRGERERAADSYSVKHLASGEQWQIPSGDLPAFLREHDT